MNYKPLHTIIIVCAYCKKLIDTKDGKGVVGTSHGICPSCLKGVKDELNEKAVVKAAARYDKSEKHTLKFI